MVKICYFSHFQYYYKTKNVINLPSCVLFVTITLVKLKNILLYLEENKRSKVKKMNKNDFNKKMISLGWLINLLVLLFYIAASIYAFEFILSFACAFAVYIGYHHKSKLLVFTSFFEAIALLFFRGIHI